MRIDPTKPLGVLFMAYGGPADLADLPGYLSDIRHGRTTPAAVLDEITGNYRAIGGASPLLNLTRAQVNATTERLQSQGLDVRPYLGMRHWNPWIEETVRDMLDDGIEQAVAIVLAPHYSALSIARYRQKVLDGLAMHHGDMHVEFIHSYHDAPPLIQALSNRVACGLQAFPAANRADVHVVFSAHSLPVRIRDLGDPYPDQLLETAQLVASHAGLSRDRWSWSYQSAGRSGEEWLGPQLEDHLLDLAARGVRQVVSVPIGFVCDHVEVLFDIDVKAQEVARQQGMTLVRPPSLNSDPLFIEALAEVIRTQAGAA